jgi:hypothetical protein
VERGKKQSMSRGDAGIMPSISGRAISSPSFVSSRPRGRRSRFHFDSFRYSPPASRNFHIYETAGRAQKITQIPDGREPELPARNANLPIRCRARNRATVGARKTIWKRTRCKIRISADTVLPFSLFPSLTQTSMTSLRWLNPITFAVPHFSHR